MLTFLFYIFSCSIISSSLCVIFVSNAVHSALYLILVYISAAALMLLFGSEFTAIALIVVYVGAIAILFLFVVMMLNIDFIAIEESLQDYLFISLLLGFILQVQLLIFYYGYIIENKFFYFRWLNIGNFYSITNIGLISEVLFLEYALVIICSGSSMVEQKTENLGVNGSIPFLDKKKPLLSSNG